MAYATRDELASLSVASRALAKIPAEQQDAALNAASRLADGYLNMRYRMPLTLWGDDLKQAVCDIAAFRLMKARGFNPESADAEMLQEGERQAIKWLEALAAGKINPVGIRDSEPSGVNVEDSTTASQGRPFVVQVHEGGVSGETFWGDGTSSSDGVGPSKRRGW